MKRKKSFGDKEETATMTQWSDWSKHGWPN